MAYPSAKWRTVACPTCGADVGEKCHLLHESKASLSKPHDGRVRLIDPDNKSLRPQREDEHGNRIIEDAEVVAKCVVKVRGRARVAIHCYPEHDPAPWKSPAPDPFLALPVGFGAGSGPDGRPQLVQIGESQATGKLSECRRCGAIVYIK